MADSRATPAKAPDAEFGALLLKMDNHGQRLLLFYSILVLAVTGFLASIVLAYGDKRSFGVGAGLIGVALLCGLSACMIVASSLRLHEQGVIRRGLFGTRRLRYQDLSGIATTPYVSTISVNFIVPISRKQLLELQFLPDPALKFKPIVFLGDFNLMQEVVAILDGGPGRKPYRLYRAFSLAHSGEHGEAATEVEDLMKTCPTDSGFLYNAACIFSMSSSKCEDAALADRYAIRAITLLRQAVAQGMDVAHLQKDPDLDSLRSRADFKKLIEEIDPAI